MSTSSESGLLPLRSVLRGDSDCPVSPKSGPAKAVSIAEPEETFLSSSHEDPTRIKQFTASISSKRMTGRPNPSTSSSRLSLASINSLEDQSFELLATNHNHEGKNQEWKNGEVKDNEIKSHDGRNHEGTNHERRPKHHQDPHGKLVAQVTAWLQAEKAKLVAQKSKMLSKDRDSAISADETDGSTSSTPAQTADSSLLSLEKLQRILETNMPTFGNEMLSSLAPVLKPRRSSYLKRRPSLKRLGGFASSDTEYQDGDVVVPTCDVILDNSKTLSYTGGDPESTSDLTSMSMSRRAEKERKAWFTFKYEIVRLAHTLRLKGWRRVPLERGSDIDVKRLSGALTNAVYVVSPPTDLPPTQSSTSDTPHKARSPSKLLLRIYGSRVEHIIDRENELGILRRLARKKIGPRLLGTFKNGRFEEFFNAQTLTSDDLRVEGTSKQIAKRMRELHEGIDLLEREREEGPFVWKNWDKWVDKCGEVTSYLDQQILSGNRGKGEAWRERGFVCGVEWPFFKSTLERYRKWIDEYYVSKGGVDSHLVFAHNDTQYGNILRLIPEAPTPGSAPSPLLLPQNTHKQLVVIDFEYASANTPGHEFANHFTEWCYNYHDPLTPWECATARYPTYEEQRRFVRSYINHRPQFNPRASATPKMGAVDALPKGSISEFLLDSRTPGGSGYAGHDYAEEERRREEDIERQVDELLKEIKIWRVSNSAMWIAWGIMQAKIPELDEASKAISETTENNTDLNGELSTVDKGPDGSISEASVPGSPEQGEEAEDEFDYLRFARDRALFFWGDVVSIGFVKKEDLPASLLKQLKFVE